MEECYRILKFGGTIKFVSAYYASIRSTISPLDIRGISEYSLNFTQKQWREENKYTELVIKSDFDVSAQFLLEECVLQRSEESKHFWLSKYFNVVHSIIHNLTKK